jgi:hypothetical protein|tara:strand:- start:296 stop:1261 length:966 start_codon:yes stop_codon:yes gene_type:complete
MISFIVPFSTIEKDKHLNLNEKEDLWEENNESNIVYCTIKTLKNINSLKCEKEILLIDNSHTWPDIKIPNVRVIKGWQAQPIEELRKDDRFMNHFTFSPYMELHLGIDQSLDNEGALTMWVSLAFHLGVQEARGEYVVLQHNDTFYHQDCIDEMIQQMNKQDLQYISVDNKKIWASTYLNAKDFLDLHLSKDSKEPVKLRPEHGGYVKTKWLGFADAYFFLCKRKFFDNYNIDWYYGDTNHGATIYCLFHDLKYLHLGPYYDNPNWETPNGLHTYHYKDKPFLTHLKGGFSENKMSSEDFQDIYDLYKQEIHNSIGELHKQ